MGNMTTIAQPDPKQAMRQNLAFLREYARRVILEGDDSLTPLEDVKEALVHEVRDLCVSFRLTERDLMVLLYRGILDRQH